MFSKLVVLLALIAAGYWYWSGPYQEGLQPGSDKQLRENAKNMERCMRQEASMAGSAGMVGAVGVAGDGEKLCAQKYNLYLREGQWHSSADGQGGY